MTPLPKLSHSAPFRWKGCVLLLPEEAALILLHLPSQQPIRQLLKVTAARAEAKAQRLNSAPGTQ